MKKLIALAAVLGIAVSSWGLAPQDGPNSIGASAASGATIAEAHWGVHFVEEISRRSSTPVRAISPSYRSNFQATVAGTARAVGILTTSVGIGFFGPFGSTAGGAVVGAGLAA